jgi:hypothetical protein
MTMSLPPPKFGINPPSNQSLAVLTATKKAHLYMVSGLPITQEINLSQQSSYHPTTTSTTYKQAPYVNINICNMIDFSVVVHHENDERYVLSQYCLIVSTCIIQNPKLHHQQRWKTSVSCNC